MTTQYDFALIAEVIRRQVANDPDLPSIAAFQRRSGVSSATLYAILATDPESGLGKRQAKLTTSKINSLDKPLGLPFETLVTIGKHRWDLLADMGVPADLIEFARLKLRNSGESGTDAAIAR